MRKGQVYRCALSTPRAGENACCAARVAAGGAMPRAMAARVAAMRNAARFMRAAYALVHAAAARRDERL